MRIPLEPLPLNSFSVPNLQSWVLGRRKFQQYIGQDLGSALAIHNPLRRLHEQLGISYVVIQGRDFGLLEKFAAEVVAPLAQADAR